MRARVRLFALIAALGAGTIAHAQSGAQEPAETGTSAISGVVSDGVTGRPIAGAVVYVGITGGGAVGRVSRHVTDAKGRFVFADLPAHDLYFLNASHFGYVNGGFGVPPFRGAPTRIRLADGEWFRDAHIRLWPPAAVSGRVLDEPAGEYFLVAVDEEEMHGWQDPRFLEQAQARATRVAIGWGDTKVQDLQVGRVR